MAKEKPEKKKTPKSAAKNNATKKPAAKSTAAKKSGATVKSAATSKTAVAKKASKKVAPAAAKPMAVPKQKRSIETRLKILSVGGDLILQKGYHNITADDIAKAAGLSTGIVYHYFRDKKDILIQALQMAADHLMEDVTRFYHEAEKGDKGLEFDAFAEKTLDYLLEYHQRNWAVHEELEALYHTDADIAEVSDGFWQNMYEKMEQVFLLKGANPEKSAENVRMAVNYIECFCHTYMHPIDPDLDQTYMRKKTIEIMKKLIFG